MEIFVACSKYSVSVPTRWLRALLVVLGCLSCLAFQLHLSVHVVYAVLSTVLLFVPMVTKPRESALGFVSVVLLTTPYYVLFIKGLAPAGCMQGINREFNINHPILSGNHMSNAHTLLQHFSRDT